MQTNFHPIDLTEQRHLSSEVLGCVVWRLFPRVTLVGGGVNSLGFYYDFIFNQPLNEAMVDFIQVEMCRFAKEAHSVRFISMMRENGSGLFKHHHHDLLAERAASESSNIIDLIQIDSFYGLCPPLNLAETSDIGHTKLIDCSQLRHLLDDEEVVITRISGICAQSAKDLKNFTKKYDSFLKKKDHRILGPKLALFSWNEFGGVLGNVIWHPKGIQLRRFLIDLLPLHSESHIGEIATPLFSLQDFGALNPQKIPPLEFEGEEYELNHSLTRSHLQFFQQFSVGISELPRGVREVASFYRDPPEFERWGLFSQCSYLAEQTTICCLKEQVDSQLISSLQFIEQIITMFDFEARWILVASRQKTPKGKLERDRIRQLQRAMDAHPRSFPFSPDIQEEEEGRGVRLELRVRDVLGREWTVSSLGIIQPNEELSSLEGTSKERFVIVTQQVWESLDCFIALLIEQYEGDFPFWLAPEQVRVMAIGEANQAYAKEISLRLRQHGVRVKLDLRQSMLGARVHEAEKERVPYLVLVGERERVKQTISVRAIEKFNQNQSMDIETFLTKIDQVSWRHSIR